MMLGALECSESLVSVLEDIRTISDSNLEKSIRLRLAHVMGGLLIHCMNPIGSIYPDLYPKPLRPAPKTKETTKAGAGTKRGKAAKKGVKRR